MTTPQAEIAQNITSFYTRHTTPSISGITLPDLERFLACWSQQDCELCLASPSPCSWCQTSQVCVPNTRAPFPFQILAPLVDENICPLGWRERWEMRAKPFPCKCSSMTLVSIVVTVLATLVGLMVLSILKGIVGGVVGRCRTRRKARHQVRLITVTDVNGEQRPLLQAV